MNLDDKHGTDLLDPRSNLWVELRYRGTTHTGYLRPDGQVELDGQTYPSPSAAGGAITGGAVNGWRRWRYVARDGQTYAIARLRGEDLEPVRVGVTGRKPSAAVALARHELAQVRVAKLTARLKKAREVVAELEAKRAAAVGKLDELGYLAADLGAELNPPDPAAITV